MLAAARHVNVPEKILLAVDVSSHMDAKPFGSKNVGSRLEYTKRALRRFVELRQSPTTAHQFGLAVLTDTATLVEPFSSDASECLHTLSALAVQDRHSSLDLANLFRFLVEQQQQDTQHVHRVVMVYARSDSKPTCSDKQSLAKMREDPRFFFDAIHLHDPVTTKLDPSTCNAQTVFESLREFVAPERYDKSYVFNVTTSLKRFYHNAAALVGHPLQRPPQSLVRHSIPKERTGDQLL
eukprot:m.17693 g.17693  ORF g.17693 m.17693 type:complete len:238 (-) comp5524_c0_seq1:170-883(-)